MAEISCLKKHFKNHSAYLCTEATEIAFSCKVLPKDMGGGM